MDVNDPGEPLFKNPITGIADCCARAASGRATANPTATLTKSLRRTRPSPVRLKTTPILKVYQIKAVMSASGGGFNRSTQHFYLILSAGV
ncbi:MAG TPA: hypothetical protein VLU23_15820 [Pseudolabrys sp.]|nr:hypothetical protein [Pseudolabrys sp.]